MLPLIAGDGGPKAFDKSKQVWARFAELITVRNEFVHPEHRIRPAYLRSSNCDELDRYDIVNEASISARPSDDSRTRRGEKGGSRRPADKPDRRKVANFL